MLKKIILCSALLLGIGEGLFGATSSYVYDDREDILKKLNVNNVAYYYNSSKQKCLPTDPGIKDFLVRNIKNGNIELKQVFDSVPGELYLFKVYTEGRIDTFLTTTTYGACQLYIDTAIKNLDVNDTEDYVDLTYIK